VKNSNSLSKTKLTQLQYILTTDGTVNEANEN